MQCLFEEVNQFYLSLKSYQNSEIPFSEIHEGNTCLSSYFSIILCATTCLSLIPCKNFKTFQKNVSVPRKNEKKLHTQEFQLKSIGGNMRCTLLQKRSTGKTTECSKHLRHISIEKDIF